jgi:FAD/FMN-containing dehydrogenase
LSNFIAFDESTGLLTLEAGVTLGEVQKTFAPKGWMLSVTPGTQFVSVGGAIANDVHGKNHHSRGTFGDNTTWLELVRSDGQILSCSAHENAELFHATIGGLGLTGLITRAQIRLQKVSGAFLDTQNIVFRDANEFLALSDESEADWQYSVSWVDCTSKNGRGIFMRGNNANDTAVPEPKEAKIAVPFVPPISLINRLSVRAFNELYFATGRIKAGDSKSHYLPYFYPLDAVKDWNWAYGPRGFYQYQMVIPRESGAPNLNAILRAIQESGQGSFLAVLKTFGSTSGPGLLSFARPGITLALDFVNLGPKTEQLFQKLDEIVLHAGGTLNPSKDARMSRQMFEAGFPRFLEFQKFRDPVFSSAMSKRLMGW